MSVTAGHLAGWRHAAAAPPGPGNPLSEPHGRGWRGMGWGFLVKLAIMAFINAFGLMGIFAAFQAESWFIFAAAVLVLVAADVVYFTKRALPLKYLLPGLTFLLIFQVFIFAYTAYIAFTNYGAGHVGSQEQAVNAALSQGERRVEDSPVVPADRHRAERRARVRDRRGRRDQGRHRRSAPGGRRATPPASGAATEVPGWNVVSRNTLISDRDMQEAVVELRVPISDDPNDGSIRTREGSTGAVYLSTMQWDPDAQTITDTATGTVYSATAGRARSRPRTARRSPPAGPSTSASPTSSASSRTRPLPATRLVTRGPSCGRSSRS